MTTSSEAATDEIARVLAEPDERAERGRAALDFARRNFSPEVLADQVEATLEASLGH